MTAKQNEHPRQAALAVASLTAGLLATALAVYIQSNPQAFTSAPALAYETDSPAGPPGQVRQTFFPRLEGRAISDVASVQATRRPARVPPVVPHQNAAPDCTPYWRELESGPVGRHVLVTCPGADGLPPPPLSLQDNSPRVRLPGVSAFSTVLASARLAGSSAPRPELAELAGHEVASSLASRWHGAPLAAGSQSLAEPSELPLQNPLSWTPGATSAS